MTDFFLKLTMITYSKVVNSKYYSLEPTYSNHFKGLMHHLGNMARHHHRTTQEICTVNSDFTNLLNIFTPLENSLSEP